MTRSFLSALLILAPGSALAGDLSIGIGAGLSADLGDRTSAGHTDFGPGPTLMVPVRYALSEKASLRGTLRADAGWGRDLVTWQRTVDGQEVRYYSDDHWSMLLGTGLTIGADAELPGDLPLAPYVGAEAGVAWVTTYHSFGGDTQILLDPTQNDLESSSNIDPFTAQGTWLTDLHIGGSAPMGANSLWFEAGYSLAFLDARPLRKTAEELRATREAYGWNPVRIGMGITLAL